MSKAFKEYLIEVIDDCWDAVHESKIGPLKCEDQAHAPQPGQPVCPKNYVVHNAAFQTFLSLVASVSPKYFNNVIRYEEPKEPWQEKDEEQNGE